MDNKKPGNAQCQSEGKFSREELDCIGANEINIAETVIDADYKTIQRLGVVVKQRTGSMNRT